MPAASPPIQALRDLRHAQGALNNAIDGLEGSVRAKCQKQIDLRATHRAEVEKQIGELQAALRNLAATL